jgi:hypothetical protein
MVRVEPTIGPCISAAVIKSDSRLFVIRPHGSVYRRLLLFFLAGTIGIAVFGSVSLFPEIHRHLNPRGDLFTTWLFRFLALFSLLWLLLFNFGILFGALSVRFDTSTELMTFGPIWSRKSRRLSQILAVQLVSDNVSRHIARIRMPKSGIFMLYQLNLALDDPNTARLCLTVHGDQVWIERTAQQLSDFLGIPLVNQIGNEKKAAK